MKLNAFLRRLSPKSPGKGSEQIASRNPNKPLCEHNSPASGEKKGTPVNLTMPPWA
jgi:hypothetical protein